MRKKEKKRFEKALKQAITAPKKEPLEIKTPKLAAPEYAPKKAVKILGPLFWKKMRFLAALLIAVLMISGIIFFSVSKIKQKGELEKKMLGFEELINGTQIQATRDAINEIIESGTAPATKQEVLSSAGKDYICTLTTERGIITLKKRGSLMREEVIRSGYNLSVLFIEDKFYMYHPQFHVWAMFPYDPEKATSSDPNMNMAFSISELRAINETDYRCVETRLPEDEFSLGDSHVVDALDYIEKSNPFR